eukprot:GHVU01069088.1.p1 GENE.GHVU01069088.1~~GHVU01069088.1.p1  ORF type:complete len:121 (+),score=2.06 GHVU01069088.1:156-518(+)
MEGDGLLHMCNVREKAMRETTIEVVNSFNGSPHTLVFGPTRYTFIRTHIHSTCASVCRCAWGYVCVRVCVCAYAFIRGRRMCTDNTHLLPPNSSTGNRRRLTREESTNQLLVRSLINELN